ncbi:site-specific integrase [Cupriavidus sp. IDO]|uniref:site-specific integrase n=1 Tax=Cupriavidus sp. IDO TaxID=1539142 RepID=UPI000578F755|nr:site-specific integrase [Cupriavidus sp. IDO]KWR90375.1 hypothetical protein RM96_10150 [Cupriavidus sp. IDO]
MAKSNHLTKRGSIYYFRRKIPLDLLQHYPGKREITRSLGTKDSDEAARIARRVSVDLDEEWQTLRNAVNSKQADAARVALLLGEPEQPSDADTLDPAHWDEAASHEQAEETAAHWDAEDEQQEKDEAEADRLERVWAIVERRRAEAGQALIPPTIRDAMASQNAPTDQQAKAPGHKPNGLTLEQIIPLWQRDRQPTSKTIDAVTRAVREAKDPDIHTIKRQIIIAMRDRWIAAGNSVATTNKKIGFIRLLLGVAKSRGLIEVNHAEGAELPPPKRAVELRLPYSPEQAETVMAATEGARESDPAMYWLPRLARWTGARLNELHQLRKDDLQAREGVPGLMITDEGEHGNGVDMRLKNQDSRRWVPLAEPVRDFAEWAGKQPDGPLFPAKPNKYGIVSDAFSKRYGRFLRETLKIKDKRITFHSWRHGFADMCRAAGVAPDVRLALMGHTEGGVSGTYGAGEGLPAKRLIDAVVCLGSDT